MRVRLHSLLNDGERDDKIEQLVNDLNDLRLKLEDSEKKRRHVEEALANIDEFNLSVLDSLPANIAVLDESGNIIYVNRSWIKYAHDNGAYSSDYTGIGINYFDVCSASSGELSKEAPDALNGMLKVLRGEVDHFELVYPCHSPTKDRWFLMYVTPYGSKDQHGIVVTHFDITSRVLAEKDVEEAKRQNEFYIDLMSHDINNMNQAALGYLELAMEASCLEDSKHLITKSVESLRGTSRLIDNVRKLQKLTSESLVEYQVDICNILKELSEHYSSESGRRVSINFMPIHGCLVIANDLIMDVFSNLISNAIKHSDPGKPLDININAIIVEEKGREYNRVTVEDNGSGIPDTVKEKLFARLQRGKTRAEGSGLGLYLVKRLVESFKGRVWVEDRVKGDHTKGSRFVVMLPAVGK